MKFYAVAKGRVPGIYTNWPDAKKQTDGFPGMMHESFKSREEAEEYLKNSACGTFKKSPGTARTKSTTRKLGAIPDDAIIVYTDGCSLGNPGPGGYGVVIDGGGKTSRGFTLTTNNRMELRAVIVALKKLQNSDKPIVIHSDSKYVVDSINKKWVLKWQKNNWTKSNGEPASNPDLWKKFLKWMENVDVEFRWVKGHAGNPLNELADQLANDAARGDNLKVDKGYLKSIGKV